LKNELEEQTVFEFLFGPCSQGVLEELSSESDYWETVLDFVNENENQFVDDLTFKQRNWLIKIKEGLLEAAR